MIFLGYKDTASHWLRTDKGRSPKIDDLVIIERHKKNMTVVIRIETFFKKNIKLKIFSYKNWTIVLNYYNIRFIYDDDRFIKIYR